VNARGNAFGAEGQSNGEIVCLLGSDSSMSQEDRASAPKRTRAVVGQDTIASKGRFRGGHEREATSRPSLSELRNSLIDADFKEHEAHIAVLEAQLEISMSQAGAHGKVSLDVNHSTSNISTRLVRQNS
jgi:hypothetical protein